MIAGKGCSSCDLTFSARVATTILRGVGTMLGITVQKQACAALGVLMVGLGTAGIVLPLVPTTPFLLLAGYLFARSSQRLHDWLLNHRHLGPYIHAWRNKAGLTVGQKWRIGTSFTVVMAISFYFCPVPWAKLIVLGVWLFWTVMLLRQRTLVAAPCNTTC